MQLRILKEHKTITTVTDGAEISTREEVTERLQVATIEMEYDHQVIQWNDVPTVEEHTEETIDLTPRKKLILNSEPKIRSISVNAHGKFTGFGHRGE